MRVLLAATAASLFAVAATAQDPSPLSGRTPQPTMAAVVLPADTVIQVTAVNDITSMHMKVGDKQQLQVATDVAQNGVIVIPRGAPVEATISYRTGKGIGGKSAKFELTFENVTVRGTSYALKGKWRQEGRGNTVGALLGSIIITGKSAVMMSGQIVNAFTAAPIPAS